MRSIDSEVVAPSALPNDEAPCWRLMARARVGCAGAEDSGWLSALPHPLQLRAASAGAATSLESRRQRTRARAEHQQAPIGADRWREDGSVDGRQDLGFCSWLVVGEVVVSRMRPSLKVHAGAL